MRSAGKPSSRCPGWGQELQDQGPHDLTMRTATRHGQRNAMPWIVLQPVPFKLYLQMNNAPCSDMNLIGVMGIDIGQCDGFWYRFISENGGKKVITFPSEE
ncbi:MAG: hypothetical protein ACI8T1_005022 [Verrucomicrobiales bacterium]